jgi:hypothetical protein
MDKVLVLNQHVKIHFQNTNIMLKMHLHFVTMEDHLLE